MIKEIRAMFPNPEKCEDYKIPETGTYCVLGAAIMYKHKSDPNKAMSNLRFPSTPMAAEQLGISNADADTIANLNDKGKFDAAWHWLNEALSGRGIKDED